MTKLSTVGPRYTIWCQGAHGGKYGKTYVSLSAARKRAHDLVARPGIITATIHINTPNIPGISSKAVEYITR